jgi:hypothetical protein
VQESAESLTLQLMQGRDTVHVWLTPMPVHAGPTGAFGFAWVEDEEKPAPAKQRLLFRWDAARGRYATSDSAGRFR